MSKNYNLNSTKKLRSSNIKSSFVSRVPVYNNNEEVSIDLIKIFDQNENIKNTILEKGDIISLTGIEGVSPFRYEVKTKNSKLKWSNKIKFKVDDLESLLKSSINLDLKGTDGYQENIEIGSPNIFHRAKTRSLYYESKLNDFVLPPLFKEDLENISGEINKGDTLYIRLNTKREIENLKVEGFRKRKFKNGANIFTYSGRTVNISDVIPQIKINKKDFKKPSQIIYEIRSLNPSGTNYTLKNEISYAELKFDIKKEKRYTSKVGSKSYLPPIQINQGTKDLILKTGDRISYTFDSPVAWVKPDTLNQYDDDYLKFESISNENKTINFVLTKDLKREHQVENLQFKILTNESFGIKLSARVKQRNNYWSKNYNLNSTKKLRSSNIKSSFVSRVPVYNNNEEVSIDLIKIFDQNENIKNTILEKGDIISLTGIEGVSPFRYEVKTKNSKLKWSNKIKFKVDDLESLLKSSINLDLKGTDGYQENIEIGSPNIFHRAKTRSLYYESKLNDFVLPPLFKEDLENISGEINKGDTLYIRLNTKREIENLKVEGFRKRKFKNGANIFTYSGRTVNISDVIPQIKINKKDFKKPSQIIYEIRSLNPSGTNYTLKNEISYAELKFNINKPERYAGIKDEKYILPPIQINQGTKDLILKTGDRISYTFDSPVAWVKPDTLNQYDDDYLKFESISNENKTINFVLIKDLLKNHEVKNLQFKILTNESFGIKLSARVKQRDSYWSKNYSIDIERLNVGFTNYNTELISGIIKSRSSNRCPSIFINENKKSITYKGDKIFIEIYSENYPNISFQEPEKNNNYNKYLTFNSDESQSNIIVFNVIKDLPSNSTIKIDNLKIDKINYDFNNGDKIFLKINNSSPVHKNLSVDEIEFMQFTQPFIEFTYPEKTMYAYDYDENFKDFYYDTLKISLKNFDNNTVKTFWEDDKISIYLPEKSGAQWKKHSKNILEIIPCLKKNNKSEICEIKKSNWTALIEKGNEQQEGFNLEYAFTNESKNKIFNSQSFYNFGLEEIEPKYFYHTRFSLDNDFYTHSEIIDTTSIIFSKIIIDNFYDVDDILNIYFDNDRNISFDEQLENLSISVLESGKNLSFDLINEKKTQKIILDSLFVRHIGKEKIKKR